MALVGLGPNRVDIQGLFFFTLAEACTLGHVCPFLSTTNIEMASSEVFLRQRKATSDAPDSTFGGDSSENEPRKEEVVWGKTPGGDGGRNL